MNNLCLRLLISVMVSGFFAPFGRADVCVESFDSSLVARIEFQNSVASTRRDLMAFAMSLGLSRCDAEDYVQDTIVRAFDKQEYFKPGTNLKPWLMTILRNRRADAALAASRRPKMVKIEHALMRCTVAAGQESHVQFQEVAQFFGNLSADMRQVIKLLAVDGMSYDEAAAAMGVPIGTIRSRASRARVSLQNMIEYGVDAKPRIMHHGQRH